MVPTRAIRIAENVGPNMAEGQRYKSEKVSNGYYCGMLLS